MEKQWSLRKLLDFGTSSNDGGISEDSIKVYVRVRPPDSYASKIDQKPCLEVTSRNSLTFFSKPHPKVFTYDQVADPNITQEQVFTDVAQNIIDGCLEGYNGTIFAYGQTGSGKTFTMFGPVEQGSFNHELRGIIPRGFEYLFNLINREREKLGDKIEFLCKCSFLEIYDEQIFDLLDPSSTGLQLREDIKRGVFVDRLLEKPVSSSRDVYDILCSASLNRRVASTSMNRESSRSHAVFTMRIDSKEIKESINNIKVSRLHLVDLAGSERQKDTYTEGLRVKQAGSINKSLSALGNVIMAMVGITQGKTRHHVPYRDSKLTFLLRDSLGGNARTHIIANVHPSARCFGETLSTLKLAKRAKRVKNKAIVNVDMLGDFTSRLQEENRKLKLLLRDANAELKELRSKCEAHYDLSYELYKTRFYTIGLERKLRDLLNTRGSGDLENSLSSALHSLETSNAELERYKSELSRVQGHLESVKEELHQTREDLQQSNETLNMLWLHVKRKEHRKLTVTREEREKNE